MTNRPLNPTPYEIMWAALPSWGRARPGAHVTRGIHARFVTVAVLGPHDPAGRVAAAWLVFERDTFGLPFGIPPTLKRCRGEGNDPRLGYSWVTEAVLGALES